MYHVLPLVCHLRRRMGNPRHCHVSYLSNPWWRSAQEWTTDDGTFTDGVGGLPEEHGSAMKRINMTPAQLKRLQEATTATHTKLVAALIKVGKYNWQAFSGGDGTGGGISKGSCTSFMDANCAPEKQNFPMMMSAGAADEPTIAAFLITRPPIGFIGWGWESDDRKWPANNILLKQPGVPKGVCVKEGNGKYSREWSNGKATLDCATWTAGLPFPSL